MILIWVCKRLEICSVWEYVHGNLENHRGWDTLRYRNKYIKVREYWMIYRGPGFLAVVRFGSSPTPFPPLSRRQVVSLSQCSFVCRRSSLLTEEGGRRGEVEREKARPSIYTSILSGLDEPRRGLFDSFWPFLLYGPKPSLSNHVCTVKYPAWTVL